MKAGDKAESMGHVWDENLEELNNPLPSWWLKLFYITMVFGLCYLVLYPGLGSFPGFAGLVLDRPVSARGGSRRRELRTAVHQVQRNAHRRGGR